MIKLNTANLSQLSESVTIPTYDRTNVKTGIVHVGIGGFHRSHQAFYTDQLLQTNNGDNWGICGVALLPLDSKIFNVLNDQNGLYTLIIKELDGTWNVRVIGAIVEFLFAPENPTAVIEKMANIDTKIITLTITEGGYCLNEATGRFEFNNPFIIHDLKYPKTPKTIFGYLTQALKLRKKRNLKGCTIQSCDNIQGNGNIVRKMLISFIKMAEPNLVEWVKENVSFPNSMVDRITPVTTKNDIKTLLKKVDVNDQWPVVCEPFIQWVIEDNFIAGRPKWENVGAQFVANVEPYEKMKLSLLNAGHSVLGILGALVGYKTIDEVMGNPSIKTFLSHFMDIEVIPVLGELKGIDLSNYTNSLLKRFGNIHIKDQVSRICSESSAKLPKFLLPTVRDQLKGNVNIEHSAFVIAAWAIYCIGLDELGNKLTISDKMEIELQNQALLSKKKPINFLEIEAVFGNLISSKPFVESYIKAYKNITEHGVTKSINTIISNTK